MPISLGGCAARSPRTEMHSEPAVDPSQGELVRGIIFLYLRLCCVVIVQCASPSSRGQVMYIS